MTLRFSNLPFLWTFLLSIVLLPRSNTFKMTALLLTCFSPLVIYNLNEARSTVALMSLSGISACGLIMILDGSAFQERLGRVALFSSIVLGACFNLLAFFVIPVMAVILVDYARRTKTSASRFRSLVKPAVLAGVILLPLLAYYVWTVVRGSGGIRERPSLFNLGHVLYEFAGFGGIGPPRNEMRQSLSSLAFGPYIVPMVLFSLLVLGLLVAIFQERRRKGIHVYFLEDSFLAGAIVGLLVFSLVSYVVSFRFLGRHLVFVYPFLTFFASGVVAGISGTVGVRSRPITWLLACVAVFWVYGDFNLRFVEAYEKDNYRLATQSAYAWKNPEGAIFWAGEACTAAYYGLYLPGFKRPEGWAMVGEARDVANLSTAKLDALVRENPHTVLVLFAKPDLFDREGAWRDYITHRQPRCLLHRRDFAVYAL